MSSGEIKSATKWVSVTPSNSTVTGYRALWINIGGNVAIRDMNGNDQTFTVTASTLLPVQPLRVLSAGTTATGIIGLN